MFYNVYANVYLQKILVTRLFSFFVLCSCARICKIMICHNLRNAKISIVIRISKRYVLSFPAEKRFKLLPDALLLNVPGKRVNL